MSGIVVHPGAPQAYPESRQAMREEIDRVVAAEFDWRPDTPLTREARRHMRVSLWKGHWERWGDCL